MPHDHWRIYDNIPRQHNRRYIVVATQGSGDLAALQAALSLQSNHIGFVGSAKKTQRLNLDYSRD